RKTKSTNRSLMEMLEGRALMSFTLPTAYSGAGSAVAISSADFNNDGVADVVVTNATGTTGTASVLLGNADGSFGAPIVSQLGAIPGAHMSGSQAGTIAAGDFDGDGKLDLAAVSSNNGHILLGNGDGTFAAPLTTL